MAEAKVFPMSTFVACLKGADKADQGLIEMLSFVTESEFDTDFAPVAAALSKAWIYEQNPELTKYKEADVAALGQKVKLAPLTDADLHKAQAVLSILGEMKKENAELATAKADLEKKVKSLEGQMAAADAELKKFRAQAAEGDKKLEVSGKKMDDYIKKVNELLEQIEKVKKEGVVVAGDAGAAGEAGAEGDAAPAAEAGDDFGFSGGGSDPFADSNW